MGKHHYTYFGARYYDSDVSVWLSVDPLADKYPHLSAYNYCENNPVMLIDPNGDSTLFYNSKGKLLHRSYDSWENTVVIVDDKNMDSFNSYLDQMIDNKATHDDSHNAYLRTLGDGYDMTDIKNWYNNELTNEWGKSETNNNGEYRDVRFEKKSYLTYSNGSVRTGKITSTMGLENYSDFPSIKPENACGGIHSHYISHAFNNPGPSKKDHRSYLGHSFEGRFNYQSRYIVVEGYGGKKGKGSPIRAIYLYNGSALNVITIYPNSFKK